MCIGNVFVILKGVTRKSEYLLNKINSVKIKFTTELSLHFLDLTNHSQSHKP